MKLDSKYFDRIRVKPEADMAAEPGEPTCEWEGCKSAGTHRAPKGRLREGEYFSFCLDHVRLYNKSYNYFAGMDDGSISDYQKAAMTGHRPTWKMGVNGSPGSGAADRRTATGDRFSFFSGAWRRPSADPEPPRRKVQKVARKSFETLHLGENATGPEIKARYKELLKRFHPDANGGDRSSEDRLREIIQAYKQLKSAGYC
ncbi:MAG: DnaJ domain-containing protein [Hyphomicrobiales bacterium]|nr:DnaJ domain-containing protein [Hyphomicrobiales bacterium]